MQVKTEDGRVLDSYDMEFRRHCEARWVFKKYRNKNTRQKYLADVKDKRGEQGRQELYDEMLLIHNYRQGKNESNNGDD